MRYFFNITLFLLSHFSSAQFTQFGIIYPETGKEENFCCTIFPTTEGLNLYDNPNGSKIGTLNRKGLDQYGNEDHYSLVKVTTDGDSVSLELWSDLKEVGYELLAIPFTEYRNGYVKVLPGIGGAWISIQELQVLGFRAIDYQTFMTEISGEVLGFYPEETLNLRMSPSASAEKIETMSYLHEISLTGKHEGQWSEVHVVKLNAGRCEGEEDIEAYELKGWIKVIDDDGKLNIWFFTRGC